MAEADVRNHRPQRFGEIGQDGGIGVLVDRDRAGRMRRDNRADSVAVREVVKGALDLGGDDEDLLVLRRTDGKGPVLHQPSI